MSGSRVSARFFAPPPDLAGVVEKFWVGEWDLRDQPPHTSELISDPAVNLVFEDGASRVVGVWRKLWVRELAGLGRVRAAKLHPGAVRAFLDVEAQGLSDRITPLEELLPGAPVAQVLQPSDSPAFAALIRWLRSTRRQDGQVARAVAAVERIRSTGITRVDQLAAEEGCSVRVLQRRFRRHVGASPKWVIRWVRLQEVALQVESGEAPDLADLAYRLGYADQAHLARDFRSATGRTLGAFRVEVHR